MTQDLILIYGCWFLLALWQVTSLPLLYLLFKDRLVDGGWAFGRVLMWLLLGSIVWFSAHLGLPANRPLIFHGIFFLLFLFGLNWFLQHKKEFLNYWRGRLKLIFIEEGLFLFGLVALSLIRGFMPAVNGLEKFMDIGFINSYLRSNRLPIEDMWLAGEKVNYYTFGHYLGSVATNFWDISAAYSYNLLLGMIAGLMLAEVFSLSVNLSINLFKEKKQIKSILAGLIATLLVVIGANGQAVWYFVDNGFSFEGYWYPDATRFIENTIHEFPSYSFIVSDLHAHVWAMPLVIWQLVNIFVWLKSMVAKKKRKIKKAADLLKFEFIARALLIGATFGLMMSTSTWDLLIYGLLLVVLGLVLLISSTEFFLPLLISAVGVAVMTGIFASPWLLNFTSISEGVKLVQERSPFWQLVVLWAPHWFLSLVTLILGKKLIIKTKQSKAKLQPQWLLIIALGVTATLLLILPELIYMKDIYPTHPRANTMFKLTFQAFIMMGLIVSYLVGLVQTKLLKKIKNGNLIQLTIKLVLLIFVLSVGIYPYFGYRDFYNGLREYKGLDGMQWLQEKYPNDYAGILWLQHKVAGRPVVLEAVGESYTEFARVSTFTGLPTVLGWRVHEWLWRGGFEIPGARTPEVQMVYEQPMTENSQSILKKYDVEYIFVGDKEQENYNLATGELLEMGKVVFTKGSTFIVKLD